MTQDEHGLSCQRGPGEQNDLQAKLAEHEEWAPAAVRFLIDWLREDGDALRVQAQGRHVWGHWRFGDKLMYEYSQEELLANASEELADAINYLSLYLRRRDPSR